MKRYLKLAGLAALMAVPSQANAQVTYNYTGANLGVQIPDNTPAGLTYDITVPDSGALTDMALNLTMSTGHTWVGDLIVTVTHNANTADIMRRVGSTTPTGVGSGTDFTGAYSFLDSAATRLVDNIGTNPVPPGNYRATTNTFVAPVGTGETTVNLNTIFGGGDINGLWTISISDNAAGDVGTITAMSLTLTAGVVPEPTSLALVGIGAGGLVLRRFRKKA